MSDPAASPPANFQASAPASPAGLRIRARPSAGDGDVMGFVLDAPLADGPGVAFDGPGDAPLARALFALGAIRRVQVAGATIWVQKDSAADWAGIKPAIAAAIRATLAQTDAPLGAPAAADDAPDDDPDQALLRAVGDLLERQVNPSVAAHGGHIAAEKVADRVVYLRMSGGCQGCAASAATLREGVERMLRAALPQIAGIVDLTDHDAGAAPFYARPDGAAPPAFDRPLPAGVIHWEDGRLMVDPDYLAPRLGLAPETLRLALRNGDVVGVTEAGQGADAGKTRITMRSPTRAWAAEIDAEGRAREIPPPRRPAAAPTVPTVSSAPTVPPVPPVPNHDPALAERLRATLQALPDDRPCITYGALARAVGLWAPGSVRRVTRALEALMHADAAAGRPFIAARAVSRGAAQMPGRGFFDLACALSRGPAAEETDAEFHRAELSRLRRPAA